VIVRRRRVVAGVAAALALAAAAVLAGVGRFASDVLDLLPGHFDSVRLFREFDREFSQARELSFAIVDETGEADLDAWADHLAAALREQEWIERVMEKSPMESEQGVRDVADLAAPLLMNLEKSEFAGAIAQLDPAAIEARISRLRAALDAGSPKAEFDLMLDPLGVVGPAMKPLAGSFSMEQTRPLASPDGTLRLVLALTKQEDLGAHACQETMRKVEGLIGRVLESHEAPKPRILVTGRTAYVGELSVKMRDDVIQTLAGTALLVGVVFWIGFRRVRPLFAMLHTLLLCCLLAVALGMLVFSELNMITIGLGAILVGLGVDFGMMLYGIYQVEREHGHSHEEAIAAALRHHGSAVVFGACTTAAAFLCMLLSQCSGFVQLGGLIAFGILLAAGLMMSLMFVLVGQRHRARPRDGLRQTGAKFVGHVYEHPGRRAVLGFFVLAALTVVAATPLGRLQFDANPKTLEPRHSQAGDALRTIQRKMPAVGEPVLAVVEAKDAQFFHDAWRDLDRRWRLLEKEGVLASVNTPRAFAISPERVAENRHVLKSLDLDASRAALVRAAAVAGLSDEGLAPALGLLNALGAVKRGELDAREAHRALPRSSPWWFVIDRFLAREGFVGVAYVVPKEPLTNFAMRKAFEEDLRHGAGSVDEKGQRYALQGWVEGAKLRITGWRYMLADLVPWAKERLGLLTLAMVAVNFFLLSVLFGRFSEVGLTFAALGLAVGALLATLKFAGIPLNLFNVLAFPLVLGVGVDYAIYVIMATRAPDPRRELTTIFKPVLLSGLTTMAGFGSLATAENPALSGLGTVCALGVGWCLVATFFFILPAVVWMERRR
jgi:hypothetical protein